MFIDMVSDFILQLIFKKLSLTELWYIVKDYAQSSGKANKMPLPFPITYTFFLHILQPKNICNRLNPETDRRIQLLSTLSQTLKRFAKM